MTGGDLTATSKFLSYVLRHNPAAIGISLDHAGWVPIGTLLPAAARHGHPIDPATLTQLTTGPGKRRFETRGGEIRAAHGGQRHSALVVTRAGPVMLGACLMFVAAATWGLTVLLRAAHDVAPFWDGLTTAASLAAQFLLNYKKIENWALWIAADLVYIPLYVVKRLELTAIVYVAFLGMCLLGVTAWRRALHAASTPALAAAADPAGRPA